MVQPALIAHSGLLDPEGLLQGFGSLAFAGVLAILLIECGIILGAVLPGDSLLFMTGVLMASGFITVPWWVAMPAMMAAAFAGNVIGYWTGQRVGPALLRRPDSRLFRREYVESTHAFFAQHGPRAIVLARFVPVVRTFISFPAGIARMPIGRFIAYSTAGAALWSALLVFVGAQLGARWTEVRDALAPLDTALVVLVVLGVLLALAWRLGLVQRLRGRR